MGFDGDEILPEEMKKISGRLFRVDANGGWSLEKAERMIHQLGRIGVVLVEQPTLVKNVREWPT